MIQQLLMEMFSSIPNGQAAGPWIFFFIKVAGVSERLWNTKKFQLGYIFFSTSLYNGVQIS